MFLEYSGSKKVFRQLSHIKCMNVIALLTISNTKPKCFIFYISVLKHKLTFQAKRFIKTFGTVTNYAKKYLDTFWLSNLEHGEHFISFLLVHFCV